MSSRVALILVIVLAVVVVGALILPRMLRRGVRVQASTDWYEIYFTDPQYPDRASAHHGGIDEKLVALMDGAKKSLDVCIYDFDLDNVASAMVRAKQRGVTVRMVTDTDTIEKKDDRPNNAESVQRAVQKVRAAGIPIVDDQRRPIMHNKFVVVDGEVLLTGSWNFTTGDTYRLNNNAVRFTNRELAANYAAEFEKMFTQRKFGPGKAKGIPNPRIVVGSTRIETYFASEEDPSTRLVDVIRGARSKVDFLAFSFTHERIGQAVLDRARAGVKVRGVFETTGSETRFSEYGKLKQAGLANLEVYQDGNPYVMHHKVFVVDDHLTVFGSFNFSDNAAEDNDENMLVVDDPAFARAFLGEVERVLARAKNPSRERDKVTRESR